MKELEALRALCEAATPLDETARAAFMEAVNPTVVAYLVTVAMAAVKWADATQGMTTLNLRERQLRAAIDAMRKEVGS